MLTSPFHRHFISALLAAVLLTACSEPPTSSGSRVAALMQIVSGDAQKAVVGTELANPLVVKVLDSAGAIVSGQVVNFRVIAGGGTVFAGANITNPAGLAQERWTLGTSTADSQRVEVRAVDNATGAPLTFAVFKAIALAGAPASMTSMVGSQEAAVGSAVGTPPAVLVADTYGNPAPGVAVAFAVASGGGSVSEPSRTTGPTGVATLTSWTLGPIVGTNTVVATVTGLPPFTFTATGIASAPTALGFVVQSSGQTGGYITPAVQVAVRDAFGNTVLTATDSVMVALAANPGAGRLLGTRTVAPHNGIATFDALWIDHAGSGYTLAASAAGLSGATSQPFDVALATFAAVSSGYGHTCGVTVAGAVYCWGLNGAGQLGGGTTSITQSSPALVAGSISFAGVSAGDLHTCGVTPAGAAYCWGQNDFGQLGDGTTTDRSIPTPVAGGISFAAVSHGAAHTCGVTAAGAVYCWGLNDYGQLGDGTFTERSSPTLVAGGISFVAVGAGRAHTCGVTAAGAAYCWGGNDNGQLGDTTMTNRLSPTLVAGGISFAAVSAGYTHTCGVTSAGVAYCWGLNDNGQLGDGTTSNRSSPTLVAGGISFATVSAGGGHTCGVTAAGAAYCWGSNAQGQLGDGTTSNRSSPTPVAGGISFAAVGAGFTHTCGVTAAGAAYCWGLNTYGQLGDGTVTDGSSPVRVVGSGP